MILFIVIYLSFAYNIFVHSCPELQIGFIIISILGGVLVTKEGAKNEQY